MWAEAIFTLTDCEDFIRSMTPLEIVLDEERDRVLFLDRPTRIELIPDRGIALEVSGQLCWSVAGVKVPISVRIARVLLLPTIETRDGQDALVFALHIERADSVLPDFVDDSITAHVNEALDRTPAHLVWSFTKTLDFHFTLPEALKPTHQVDLAAKWGQVRVTEEALVLAVSFKAAGVSTTPDVESLSQIAPANSQDAIH
jgi:hypothetical protein